MVNLNLYNIFCCVAKEKNISKASEILFISQPAVSFSIKQLEKELGQTLFIRKSKGVELTEFGKMLYEKVNNLIGQFDDAENLAYRFAKLQEGVIRIGAGSSNVNQILLEYLTKFVKKYPKIQIIMERDSTEKLVEKLNNNDLDMIFVDKQDNNKHFVKLKEFDVIYQLLGDRNYKQKYPENNIDLKNFPVDELMLPSVNNHSRLSIDKFFEKANIKFAPKYELDNYILLYEFVKKGFGIAFVNIEYYRQAVERGEAEIIYPDFSIPAREIECLINKNSSNPALDKFVEIVQNS